MKTFADCRDTLYRGHPSQITSQTGELLQFHSLAIGPALTLTFRDGAAVEFHTVYAHVVRRPNGREATTEDCEAVLACIEVLRSSQLHTSSTLLKFPEGHGANVACVGGTRTVTMSQGSVSFQCKQFPEPGGMRRYLLAFLN